MLLHVLLIVLVYDLNLDFYIIQIILKEVKKKEEVVWGITIIVFIIWSMYEGTMYFIGKNFVFLFLGLNKNSMIVNLKKEKKYDS